MHKYPITFHGRTRKNEEEEEEEEEEEQQQQQKNGYRSRRRLVTARSARLAKSEAMPTRFEGGDRGQVHWTCGLGSLNRGGDMPKGRLYNWEGVTRMGRQNPETLFCRKLACCLSVCVLAVSNTCLKDSSCAHHTRLHTHFLPHITISYTYSRGHRRDWVR
jgi:hypothetical protein